jgi:anti-sigma B factor antagonist
LSNSEQITEVPISFFKLPMSIHSIFTDSFCAISYTRLVMAIDGPLQIEIEHGKTPGTLLIRLTGPLTLRNIFDLQAQFRTMEALPLTILDLTGVPYMDSAGMGVVVNCHVHCQSRSGRLVAVGVSSRILALFEMTHVDKVIAMAQTLEEAEALV